MNIHHISKRVQLSLFLCLSMCLGIGILRFSYTVLLPVTREDFSWSLLFSSLLGSANLLGYFIGTFWAMCIAQNRKMITYLQVCAWAGTLSLLCCAFSGMPDFWYIFWRIISGISGAFMMILSPSIVALCCQPSDRLFINFIGFTGIGLGVLLSTLFLPYLDQIGAYTGWLIFTGFAICISIAILVLLSSIQHQLNLPSASIQQNAKPPSLYFSLIIVYGCSAFAYVPHSLFWVDYLSHDLLLPLSVVNMNWILYGLGSALGAGCSYLLAKSVGNLNALKILYSVYIVAIFMATFSLPIFTFISSFLTGLLNPAVVFLTSFTILQLYTTSYKKLWSLATLGFASIQFLGGLTFSALQKWGLDYHQQFMIASFVLLLGVVQLFFWTRSPAKSTKKMRQI